MMNEQNFETFLIFTLLLNSVPYLVFSALSLRWLRLVRRRRNRLVFWGIFGASNTFCIIRIATAIYYFDNYSVRALVPATQAITLFVFCFGFYWATRMFERHCAKTAAGAQFEAKLESIESLDAAFSEAFRNIEQSEAESPPIAQSQLTYS